MIKQGWAKETISLSFNCQFLLRCQSVVEPYRHAETAIHKSMCPTGCPENTRLACTLGTSKTNPFYSYQGVQVPVQAWTLSPQHYRPGLSMVLRPPQPNIYNHPKKPVWKEPEPAPISKYMLGTINLWLDQGPCNEWSLIDTGGTNATRVPLCYPTRSKSIQPVPPDLQLSIYIYIPCDSNMIVMTVVQFLPLASDRQSLNFYRDPIA
jgi:hypothetical protein